MAEGIGEILTYAVGVAIVPVAIIAVILMLFSSRARVNGPMFVAGWVVALGAASAVAYLLADAADVGTDETASDTVSWGKLAVGVFFLLLAVKQWRGRPAPGGNERRNQPDCRVSALPSAFPRSQSRRANPPW